MLSFSAKKWNTLSTSQKIKHWINIFIEIERDIANKKDLTHWRTISDKIALLENETDPKLKKIYAFTLATDTDEHIKTTLRKLYDHLRETLNDELQNQKDFHFLQAIKTKKTKSKKQNIVLILDNLRSAFNVGSIIRTAECLKNIEIWCCGYTPIPTQQKVKNTSLGCENFITWKQFNDTCTAINEAKTKGFTTFALETEKNAISIYETKYPQKIAIVVGNEALGIEKKAIKLCDHVINIPIKGWKKSLNVATATAIVCCEIIRP